MTVAVMINGKGPYHFVVDTGAVCSVISHEVAVELALPAVSDIQVNAVTRAYQTRSVRVEELSFGPVSQSNLVLPVLPRDWLVLDGYIGLDMIDRFRITFDFKRNQLHFGAPRTLPAYQITPVNYNTVPAEGNYGRLRVSECQVDGVDTTVFIDTGASITTGNGPLFDALQQVNPDLRTRHRRAYIDDIAGGSLPGYKVDFDTVRVGNVTFNRGTMLIADLGVFKTWQLSEKPALILGMNFLRQFDAVSIDYGSKEFHFEVRQARA